MVVEAPDLPRLPGCLTSIADQQHPAWRALLCPVGDVALPPPRDWRVDRLGSSATVAEAVARGAAAADGAFIGLVRGCDRLPPSALARLAGALRASGSTMATGRLRVRGRPDGEAVATFPRAPGRRLTPREHPELAGDLALGNRLVRLDRWRDLAGSLSADDEWRLALPVARLLASGEPVDVLAVPVYELAPDRGRLGFGASSSTLGELEQIGDRSRQVAEALGPVPELVAGWRSAFLDVELPRLLRDAERADPEQWTALTRLARSALDGADAETLDDVAAGSKASLWLAAQDRREDLVALGIELARLDGDTPTRLRGRAVLADWASLPADVPEELRRIPDRQTRLVGRVHRIAPDPGADPPARLADVFLRIDLVDPEAAPEGRPVEVTARLGGESLPVEPRAEPAAERWVHSRFRSGRSGAVRIRVPGETPVSLALEMRVGDLRRRAELTIPSVHQVTGPGADVRDIGLEDDVVVVRTDDLSRELRLVGEGVRIAGGPRPDGSVRLPLVVDRFGRTAPAPVGHYRLDGASPARRPRPTAELLAHLPREDVGTRHRLELSASAEATVTLWLRPPLADDELGPRAQALLQAAYRVSDEAVDHDVFYFETFAGRAATGDPLAVYAELRRRRSGLTAYWGIADHSHAVPEGAVPVLLRSRAWYDVLARAGWLVLNTDVEPWFRKRPGQRVLQCFHGYPSKAMGARQWRANHLRPSEVAELRARGVDTWDVILTPTPEMTALYREQYAYDGTALEHGYPRNDALTSPAAAARRSSTRELLGIAEGQIAVLYAPTWRDHLATRHRAAAMADHLDVDETTRELGDSHVLLLRGHRFHTAAASTGTAVDVTDHPEINDLMLASDVAVLDYSSLRFDFALTGRPMVFLVPDLAEYDAGPRRFLFPFADSAPGPLLTDAAAVAAAVRDPTALTAAYAERLAAFNARFNTFQDGHAAERVVDHILGVDGGSDAERALSSGR